MIRVITRPTRTSAGAATSDGIKAPKMRWITVNDCSTSVKIDMDFVAYFQDGPSN